MGRANRLPETGRTARFETFEERLVLSAQPVSDLLLNSTGAPPLRHFAELAPPLEPLSALMATANDIHGTTGVTAVRNAYGFDGWGQTVVIIDSGIAYDHQALGRGFGTGQRVVGGWDFAENDANPYDDGPAGFHGTHVAGIVGGSSATYKGVAPGVDLVGLRVFDDNGAGYFEWVERSLQWVHQHRNDYRFPITTVNMSLGTDWNSTTVPNWSTIENELAQLKSDGIFVAVAAGNSFGQYNAPGLSYPAASPHVVPVMSVTSAGILSSFSQRHARALAAPGQNITSTVPDHVYGSDGVANDYGTASGTSMAAPYMAGVSVLLREAMQFVGHTGITQDTIYNHLRSTADAFFDSATNASYLRINAQRAIDSLMPGDDFGSTVASASGLGTLRGTRTAAGVIGRLDDIDYFTFTAGTTGNLDLTATASGKLTPRLVRPGATASDSGAMSFQVVAGQTYTVGIQTSGGIGRYDLAFNIESRTEAENIGDIAQKTVNDVRLAGGERWYEMRATRDGLLTVEALVGDSSGSTAVELYSASRSRLGGGSANQGGSRLDMTVVANQSYLVRLSGSSQDVDLRFTNLVSTVGNEVRVQGTDADDLFVVSAGPTWTVSVNDVAYRFTTTSAMNCVMDGRAGQDTVRIQGASSSETAVLGERAVAFQSANFRASGASVERVEVSGGGGADKATLRGGAGNDLFGGHADRSSMVSGGDTYLVRNFAVVVATGGGGTDTANLHDSAGNDRFVGNAGNSTLEGSGFRLEASGFRRVNAYSSGGSDTALFNGTSGADNFFGYADRGWMTNLSGTNFAHGFRSVTARGAGGTDTAYLFDSAGNDLFVGTSTYASLEGQTFSNRVEAFKRVSAFASAGNDVARLYDSAGNDRFTGHASNSQMEGSSFLLRAVSFKQVYAYATAGGRDVAVLYGNGASSRFVTNGMDSASLSHAGFQVVATGFSRTTAYSALNGSILGTFSPTQRSASSAASSSAGLRSRLAVPTSGSTLLVGPAQTLAAAFLTTRGQPTSSPQIGTQASSPVVAEPQRAEAMASVLSDMAPADMGVVEPIAERRSLEMFFASMGRRK